LTAIRPSLIPNHREAGCRLECVIVASKITFHGGFVKREKGMPSMLGRMR